MKILLSILVLALIANAGTIHPQLADILKPMKPADKLQVIVHMKNHSSLDHFPKGTPKEIKLLYLEDFAENGQREILAYLQDFGKRIENLKTFWIFNGFTFKAPKEIIEAVAIRQDVDYVIDDFIIKLEPQMSNKPAESRVPEWGIVMISAPQCWNDGYDGAGIIVGNMDTGVEEGHPALTGKWVAGGWFDAVNSQPTPYDDHGHGTHTMGTICGGDGNGPFVDDIGVAPGATFIAAKCFDADGSGQAAWIHASFQWIAGQTVNVVCNSWGSSDVTSLEYWDDCLNWRSLGIYPVFAVHNYGPNPGTAGTPGNFPIVHGIGATDSLDNIAGFSGRGPAPDQVPWNEPANWARPDWDLIKPDVSAPGVDIRSAAPGGGYALMSGTSMATPHVTGGVAVCLQKNSSIDYITLYNIILDEADEPSQGAPYPNNDYGWGRMNLYAALNAVPPPVPHHNIRARYFSAPEPRELEFSTIQPGGVFRNSGTFDENDIPVTCLIQFGGSTVYTSNRTIPFLATNSETLVTFDNFTLGSCGSHYQAIAFSSLPGDTFFNDDTMTLDFAAARIYEIPTPGCLAWKYPNTDSGVVPIPTDAGWIPATATEIQQISVLDSDWWVTAGATDSAHQDLQLYGFQLGAADTLIEELVVEWWGHHGSAPHDRLTLYMWNDQASTWSQKSQQVTAPNDIHFTATLNIDSITNYVSADSFFYVSTGADVYIKSCCPLLFTFNGEKNVFIADFISGGDIGTWVGRVLGQNIYLPPDYDEYVKIDEENLACVDGKYRVTLNEMLQEVTYLDEAKLYVVDHPTEYDIYPHEALLWPGYEGLTLHTSKERPLKAAHDALGRDILYTLTEADRVYVPFEKLDITGFTKPFEVILDVGELSDPSSAVLYLYGSTRFPDAGWIEPKSDIYEASKQGLNVRNPKVEVIDEYGRWQAVSSCGMPAGHKKTVTFPLYDDQGISIFKSQDHRIRLSLTQEVYLDKAWVSCAEQADYQLTELMPSLADLHYYGYAAYTSVDGKYPGDFCYEHRVAKNHANVVGYYTKYGDVSELLGRADSRFVVMNHGDEIGLEFDAANLPELKEGWTRDFIFAAKGFYKMARPGRAYAYSVDPLPFYGMREDMSANGVGYYPYDPSPNFFGTLLGRIYAKFVWDYPFSFKDAVAMVKSHLTGKLKNRYPTDLAEYCQTWNTRHVGTYFPKLYADLPPHVNIEGVPLCEVEGDWTSHLASLGIPFGDHSLHSNYVLVWMTTTIPVGVEELNVLVPTQVSFSIGYPNPFRGATTMRYTIPLKTEVHLDIYDATGRLVRRLVDDTQKPGAYSMRWDGADTHGSKCASGIYFVKFEAGDYTSTRKTVLLK